MLCFKDGATCFKECLCQSHVQVGRHEKYILSRIKIWNNFAQLALPYTQCHRPSCSSPNTKHVFQKLLTSNPGMSPVYYYQACDWFHFSIKTCLSKRRGTVHLFHACNKLCKKFSPYWFAALQNCEWAYVASESLP